MCFEQSLESVILHSTLVQCLGYSLLPQYRINFLAEECLGSIKTQVWISEEKRKRREIAK